MFPRRSCFAKVRIVGYSNEHMHNIRAFLKVVEDDHLMLLGQRVGGDPQ